MIESLAVTSVYVAHVPLLFSKLFNQAGSNFLSLDYCTTVAVFRHSIYLCYTFLSFICLNTKTRKSVSHPVEIG